MLLKCYKICYIENMTQIFIFSIKKETNKYLTNFFVF